MTDLDDGAVAPGTRLGSYRIERKLGRGGMGTVLLAYDSTLHRQVALKVISGPAEIETSRARVLREARNAAALNHPNICTIYEVGEAGEVAYIAMEHVEGRSLRDRLDAGALPLDEALRCGRQAAAALAYAHEHGVVHRDFKAANVILGRDGRLKVVDFGLAQRREAATASATTMVSLAPDTAVAGTPYAMAPEQVRGAAADASADIWALGVLLYEMSSGARPFEGASTPELFSSILRDAPSPLPATVPVELRAVIARCLEKTPELRYRDAGQVGAALEAIQAGLATRTPAPRRRRSRRPWWAAGAALVAVAAVLVGLDAPRVRAWLAGSDAVTGPIRLAVLPLENLTGDPQNENLSEGLTEEIISRLGRLRSDRLSVVARAASMPYQHSTKSVSQIGRELGASLVLKGSFSRSGDRVRILAELTQVPSGRPLWKETYEGAASDLFALERQLSRAVSGALGIQPAEPGPDGPAGPLALKPAAYELYLRGLSHALRNNEKDIDQAISLLEQSAAIDPTFVPAQAYLAWAYGNKASIYRPDDPQWEEKGFAAARKALDLDPDAPEANFAQAVMLWRPSHGFPSREALQALRKALAARPDFDEAWHQHGVILFHVGHLDAALSDLQKALQINPAHTVARFRLAPVYVYQQKFEEAIAALDRVPPESFPSQWTFQRAWALISLGRLEEAGRLVDGALKDNPADQGGVLHAARAMLRAKRGDRQGAEADVTEAIRVGRNFIHFHHTEYAIGAVETALGNLDRAQEWIEKAANDGFPNYTFFERDVHLVRLRATPKFRAFLAKLRLEWEHIPGEPD